MNVFIPNLPVSINYHQVNTDKSPKTGLWFEQAHYPQWVKIQPVGTKNNV